LSALRRGFWTARREEIVQMIQTKESEIPSNATDDARDQFAVVIREILRAVKSVEYGTVELVIRNSRVVRIQRKEKFRCH